jgi:tRNA(fMet)-specific endonuclease VapC
MTPYILDTDTLSLLQQGHPRVSQRCRARPPTDLALTVISVEEQLSGWYTALRKARRPDDLARVYQRLADTVQFLSQWKILPFTTAAIFTVSAVDRLETECQTIGPADCRNRPGGWWHLGHREHP